MAEQPLPLPPAYDPAYICALMNSINQYTDCKFSDGRKQPLDITSLLAPIRGRRRRRESSSSPPLSPPLPLHINSHSLVHTLNIFYLPHRIVALILTRDLSLSGDRPQHRILGHAFKQRTASILLVFANQKVSYYDRLHFCLAHFPSPAAAYWATHGDYGCYRALLIPVASR